MRVLYVNKISPLAGGGAELRLGEIARQLATRGHEVHIVCGKQRLGMPDEETVDGVQLHNVHVLPDRVFRFGRPSFFLARYGFYARSIPTIARWAMRTDIVVDCATPVVSAAGPLARRYGKPCVVTLYETFGHRWFQLKGPVTALLGYAGERLLLSRTYDGYMTTSEHTRADLLRQGKPADQVYYLRHGAGVKRLSGACLPAKQRQPVVTCISRLVKQKNVASLLRAWMLVREQRPEVELRIIGDGPEKRSLHRLADALGISASVRFEGPVTDEEKWEIMDQSTLFAAPSLQEGFGIVLLEAMLVGLPIVAYDLPVYRQFLCHGQHGLFVTPGDHESLATAILQVLGNDEARTRMSERNAEYASEWTWERAAEEEEQVLLELLRRSNDGGARPADT